MKSGNYRTDHGSRRNGALIDLTYPNQYLPQGFLRSCYSALIILKPSSVFSGHLKINAVATDAHHYLAPGHRLIEAVIGLAHSPQTPLTYQPVVISPKSAQKIHSTLKLHGSRIIQGHCNGGFYSVCIMLSETKKKQNKKCK